MLLSELRTRISELTPTNPGGLAVAVFSPWPNVCIAALAGEMDLSNAGELAAELGRWSEPDSHDVVLDLSGVTFIDSCGISEVIKLANHVSSRGAVFAVAAPSPSATQVIDILKLTRALRVEDSLERALNHIGALPTSVVTPDARR